MAAILNFLFMDRLLSKSILCHYLIFFFQIDIDYSFCTPPEFDSNLSLAYECSKYKEKIIVSAREKAAKFRDQSQKNSVDQIFALLDSGKWVPTLNIIIIYYLFI